MPGTGPRRPRELRLALGMRGGVSLAVWIGGACAEIDELRRARPGDGTFWGDRLAASGQYDRVVVDVLAGASAGGVNGVLFALAIRHGFSMGEMRDVWHSVADVDALRRTGPPWTSVLDGDGRVLGQLRDRLGKLVRDAAEHGGQPSPDQSLDLRLSATLVEPIRAPTRGPADEAAERTRSSATFHFRWQPDAPVPTDDLGGDDGSLWRLAVAARATGAYPGAFEPAVVRSARPEQFGETVDVVGSPMVDCGRVFSERRGAARCDDKLAADDFVVADGGIVDNIPLGKAIDAIVAAPADRPTARVLLYLHPSGPRDRPPPADVGPQERREIEAVVRGMLAARLAGETIEGDLAQLFAQRRAAAVTRLFRESALRLLPPPPTDATGAAVPPWAALADQWVEGYRLQRALAGAADLRRLLDDPVTALGADRFPMPPADGGTSQATCWYAPLAGWADSVVDDLDAALTTCATPAGGVGTGLFQTGVGPVRRMVQLVIEWVRALEDETSTAGTQALLGDSKGRLYDLAWLIGVVERRRNLGWVVRAGVGARPADARTWTAETVALLNALLRVGAEATAPLLLGDTGVVAQYVAACDRALQVLVDDRDRERVPDDLAACLGALRGTGGDDLRLAIVDAVGAVVDEVIAGTRPLPDECLPALIDRVLRSPADPGERLAAVEVLCFPEFAAGATGTAPIAFERLSAAARTPLATAFVQLKAATQALDDAAESDQLAPEVKLAGNELANFSAFFKQAWRDNDWLWGRLDAVPTLVRLLDPSADPVAVAKRQRQILRDHFDLPDTGAAVDACMAAHATGLETLRDPPDEGIADSVDALVRVAANVAAAQAPGPLRRLAAPLGHLASVAVRSLYGGPRAWWRRALARVVPLLVGATAAFVAFGLAESKVAVLAGFVAGVVLIGGIAAWLVLGLLRRPVATAGTAAATQPAAGGGAPSAGTPSAAP